MKIFFLILFLSLNSLAFAQIEHPDVLGENLEAPSNEVILGRASAIANHQNSLRSPKGLPLLEATRVTLGHIDEGHLNVPTRGGSSVTVQNRGNFSYISEFDDKDFLNYSYTFNDQNELVSAIPLAEYALKLARGPEIELFRLMSSGEYSLWQNKDLKTLMAWPGMDFPGFEFWGFDRPVTHTSPFVRWPSGTGETCGKWVVPKKKLLEWAKDQRIAFGLTGQIDSKDYELIVLESAWEEFIQYPFGPCE